MELVFLLLCVGIGVSVKSAWDHMGDDRRKSGDAKVKAAKKTGDVPRNRERAMRRRHAIGWWIREAGGGFPVARTGWHAGWIAHRRESRHQRHIREEARTSDLEAKAAYGPALRDHKTRQKALRDEIIRVYDDSPPAGRTGRQAVQEAADAVVLHPDFPRRDDWVPDDEPGDPDDESATSDLPGDPYPVRDDARPDDSDHLRPGQKRCPQCGGSGAGPAGACSYCRGWGSADPDPDAPLAAPGTICGACGHPGTDADPVLTEGGENFHRSHAVDAAANRRQPADQAALVEAHNRQFEADTAQADGDWPAGIPHRRHGDASLATEGKAMPTGTAETTYDQTVVEANGIIAECEQEIARLQARRLAARVEQMASAGLDSGSIGRAMEIDDALKAQEKAAQQALDAAQAFRDGLKRDHGAMNEAHQGAPVVGAQPEFYAG
jgi:hypothetical protein